ncbi:hypothetical protein AWC38_SpisGene23893 [Stylophora pistillata]|uniref:Uncharacterized protein n=1 Tax=Stylophora pistillata TaxID=50429 RepID=A0A2B4R746_STYPI|nr:hypothetical protein AWC38_SpisGene23893 [Stylophora pistillata]
MNCFATSSDERTIVGAAGRTLMFFDTRTTRRVNGPFEISKQIIDNISHLEYSPDNQFIFFGRLDKWFSVERECIEDFLQFDGNATVYQWGFRTRDGESIVVKRNVENFACHCPENTCLCNLLALWAVKEIEKSRDGVMSLQKELAVEGPVNCLLKCLSYKTYPAETRVMSLHEGLAIEGPMNRLLKCLSYKTYPAETRVELESLLGGCHFCYKLSSRIGKGYEEASLTAVRQKILEIYPFIFQCQIWDLKMGRPVLERAFIPNVQLEPFTYICHVSYFVNRWAMEIACSDVSVCNIAIITAIRYLEGSLGHRLQREPPVDLKPAVIPQLSAECTDRVEELLEDLLERDMDLGLAEELKRKVNVNLETVLKRIKELEEQQRMKLEQISGLEQELDLKDEIVFLLRLKRVLNPEVESIRLCMALDLEPNLRLNLLARKLKKQLEQVLKHERYRSRGLSYSLERLHFEGIGVWEPYLRVLKEEKMEMDPNLARELQHGSIECEDCTNLPEWLHDVESIVNEHIFICHSPGGKWVLEADGFRNKHILRKRNRELSCDHETPQRDIEKFTRFSFTKNDSYFVYLTDNGLLHALSLETGAVLTSLPNNQIMYFTRQVPHACGYFFCSDTEEKVILLSDLFSPFKFIPASPVELAVVEKTIAAVFCSTNTVLAVGSDLNVSFWQTPEAQDGFSFISKSLLNTSGLQVKNCALSPNGQHIAIYQGSKLMLYTMTDFTLAETDTVFEEQFGCTVSSLTFSGDSASLLLCIQAFPNFTRGDVWDVVGKVVSSSVKSQNLFTVECCCLLSDKQEVILCGQYQIEIWKYGESSCHLLTLIHVEKIYHSLRFTQCIVSSDNQLLVCCIANTILIYRRNTSNVNSSKRVLHGHLGKIEFFQFLKEDRYLISYGIDGMVFLWDTSGQEDRCKAVGFTKIPLDTVVCMAVSPDEEKIVCFSSINLMCLALLSVISVFEDNSDEIISRPRNNPALAHRSQMETDDQGPGAVTAVTPKALEHPTNLPNPQPSHEPSARQAPVTPKPEA